MNTSDTPAPVVPVERSVLPWTTTGKPSFWCSIPSDTLENKLLRYAAREGDCEDMDSVLNTEVVIKHLLLEEIDTHDDGGELIRLMRVVMILEDGRMIGSTSKGIVGCLQTACEEWAAPPWEPGLRFKVISKQIDKDRRTYKLWPVMTSVTVGGKKK